MNVREGQAPRGWLGLRMGLLSGRASEEWITKQSQMEEGTGLTDGKRTGPGRQLAVPRPRGTGGPASGQQQRRGCRAGEGSGRGEAHVPRPTPHDSTAAKGSWGHPGTHPAVTAAAAACGRASSAVSAARPGCQGCLGRKGQSPGWGPGLPEVQAEDESDPPARRDRQRGAGSSSSVSPHWGWTGGAVFLGPRGADFLLTPPSLGDSDPC